MTADKLPPLPDSVGYVIADFRKAADAFDNGEISFGAEAEVLRDLAGRLAALTPSAPPVAYRFRHSQQENWYYDRHPKSWWECQPLYTAPGDKFNDRNHAALKSRAETAERQRDALRTDAARYRWLRSTVTERLTDASLNGDPEHSEHKTEYVFPKLIAWTDFCGSISLDEAIDAAITAASQEKLP